MIKRTKIIFLIALLCIMLILITNKVKAENNADWENNMEQIEIMCFSDNDFSIGSGDTETNFWELGILNEGRKYRIVIENYDKLESKNVLLYYPDNITMEDGYWQRHSGKVVSIPLEKLDENSNKYYYDFNATDFDNNKTEEIGKYYLRINFKNANRKDNLYKLSLYGEKIESVGKVTGLEAESKTTSSIKLKWNEQPEAKEYEVWYYNEIKDEWECIGNTEQTSYEIKNLKEGNSYRFKIRAMNILDEDGEFSNEISEATKVEKPSKVVGLKKKSETTSSITLNWSAVPGATIYEIYQYNNSSKSWENVGSSVATTYTVNGLEDGTTYKFKVRACKILNNEQHDGDYSSELQAQTKLSNTNDTPNNPPITNPTPNPNPTPNLPNNNVKIDKTITIMKNAGGKSVSYIGLTANIVKTKIENKFVGQKVLDKLKGNIGTGTVVKLVSGGKITVIYKGDVNGDGRVSITDAAIMVRVSNGKVKLTPEQEKAGDIGGVANKVNASDAAVVVRLLNGGEYAKKAYNKIAEYMPKDML